MSRFISASPAPAVPQPRIFKIVVREDANEVGMVVAYPVIGQQNEANVKGQIKSFGNETEKLRFLANAKEQGFRNFETTSGKLDVETIVLGELARRQKMEEKEASKNDAMVT